MEPDRPGWYLDSRRPGLRRYWDGEAWVDVDQVLDGDPAPGPGASVPFLVAQRRPGEEPPRAPESVEDTVDDESRPPVEPGPLPG